ATTAEFCASRLLHAAAGATNSGGTRLVQTGLVQARLVEARLVQARLVQTRRTDGPGRNGRTLVDRAVGRDRLKGCIAATAAEFRAPGKASPPPGEGDHRVRRQHHSGNATQATAL